MPSDVAPKEGSMAKQKRITARQSPQDLPLGLSRVVLYARVSTSNGHQDPEMQLAELREYADRRGWEIVGEYTDQGVSGSKESRPQLNRLMVDAHRRQFDAVLVWKIDRFGRALKHLVNALADLGAYGIAFISLRDNLDLSTPSGRLMFQIIGAIAEFERALIQERVKAGLRNAQAKGKKLGRPRRVVDASRIAGLRGAGASCLWKGIRPASGSLGKRIFANANLLSGGSARSALSGTLPVNCRRRVDTG
jgi:DNA invertase Pin-like site-specific DNA recombinase